MKTDPSYSKSMIYATTPFRAQGTDGVWYTGKK